MCRFVAYIGKKPLVLGELIENPPHSLIRQSHAAREGLHGLNADGFGLAWYNPALSPLPGLFKSTQPAWNDCNLHHVSSHIASSCFMAHIRASTVGDVTQHNCHPFAHQQYSFVHNGTIRHMETLKRELLNTLEDGLFDAIRGNTDSECFFFLIMHFLQKNHDLIKAIQSAWTWVVSRQAHQSDEHFTRLNAVLSDGHCLLATRLASKDQSSLSLYYKSWPPSQGWVVSSEPLDEALSTWQELPEQHALIIEPTTLSPRVFAWES